MCGCRFNGHIVDCTSELIHPRITSPQPHSHRLCPATPAPPYTPAARCSCQLRHAASMKRM
jgi:hypothetical protein